MSDFDWNDEESVVIKSQAAIAVYGNERGNVVIREERHLLCDEDAWIEIARDRIPIIVDALLREAGLDRPQLALPAPDVASAIRDATNPAPTTAAERQRRYRERKRNAERDANVTERNGP